MSDQRSPIADAGKLDKNEEIEASQDSGFHSGANLQFSSEISQEFDDSDEKSKKSSMIIDSGVYLSTELSLSEKISKLNLKLNDLNKPPVEKTVEDVPWDIYFEQDEDGDTHLHAAIFHGLAEVALALIRAAPHKSLLDTANDAAQTPLHLAVRTSQYHVARWLIIAGAKPCPRDAQGDSPLHLAVRMGDFNCVKSITEPVNYKHVEAMVLSNPPNSYDKPKLDQWNYLGQTPLHVAARFGHLDILKHLITCGGDINAREGLEGITPLHYAVQNGEEDMVKYLLTECQSLNPDMRTYGGRNAWQWCMLVSDKMGHILRNRGLESPHSTDSEEEEDDEEEMPYELHDFANLVNASA